MTGILVFALVALAACNSQPPRADGEGNLLAAGIPAIANTNPAEQDSSPMVVRRVWFQTGLDFDGGPSPDGRYLTFVDWPDWGPDGGACLAVHDLRTGKNRRVAPEPSPWAYVQFSAVSPDGERIAYSQYSDENGHQLRLIDFDGGNPRILYHDGSYQVQPREWSGDGESLLVFAVDNRENRIGLISTRDGSLRVLKTLGQQSPFEVSISPDGRHVIYDRPAADEPQRDVYVIDVATGGERTLVQHGADDVVLGWAPDGEHVLFASDRTGTFSAWLLPVVDGMPAATPRLVKPDLWRAQPIGFAGDGSFFYGVRMHMTDVYVATLDLETGQLLGRPTRISESHLGSNGGPEWSPDGRYVAYFSERRPWRAFGDEVIVIRSMDTGEEKELQPNLTSLMYLRWSPDGRTLLVRGKDEIGRGLFQIQVQSGEVEPLIRFPPGSGNLAVRMEWLAGGRELLYWWFGEQSSNSLRVRNLDTGGEKVLYEGHISPRFGLSPDKRQLAFTLHQGDRAALMIVPTVGGEPQLVLYPEFGAPSELQWGPDGKYLYYKNEGLWRVPASGGQPERLDWYEEIKAIGFFRFQPDGHRIAVTCEQGEVASEVWVMEDFLPDRRIESP
jgi:Tol biopolymer transport system component